MNETPRPAARHEQVRAALTVVLIYGVFAALWILLSDRAVEALLREPDLIIQASLIKGWFFVAITTLLLYLLVKHLLAQQASASQCVIDDLRAKQHALDLLTTVVDNTEDAIYAQDVDGRYLLFNQAACQFMGKAVTQVLGNDDYALFPPEQADMLTMINRRIMSTGNPETHEGRFDTATGPHYFIVSKRPLRDRNDRIIGTFGIARDITDRKQAEDVVAESESRFRALVEQSLAGIYIIQEGYFRYVNPGFAAIFGYDKPEELIDKVQLSDLASPEDNNRRAENIRKRVDGDLFDIQYTFGGLRRDGSHVDVEVHGRIFEYQGKPAVIGLILDVTARTAAEAELRQRNDELERFNRATIGRELDMVELKQQINALARELGRNPPYALGFLDPGPDASGVPREP